MTAENKNLGFIKIYRSMMADWEWWDEINTFRLFMTILISVNWKEKKWKGYTIPRGSMFTSIASLSEMSGLTIQQTRTSLERLISTNEITSEVTSKGRLITVVNYGFYQDYENEATNEITSERTGNQQASNKQANKRVTTTKESKEYKNIRKGDGKRPDSSSVSDYIQSVIEGIE